MECGNDQCSAASTLRLSVAVWVGTVGAFPDLTVSSKTKIDQCAHVREGSRLCENSAGGMQTTRFLFGGWSWRFKRFYIYPIHFSKTHGRFLAYSHSKQKRRLKLPS